MNQHHLAVRNLHHVYPDGTAALRDVSFTVARGESVAVIGANGAGKSTLLQHLNGCLSATAGSITVGELAVGKKTLPEIRRRVGMLFQDPDDQLFMPSVYEDVAFGPMNMGLSGAELESCVTAALERVDGAHLARKAPYLLSGGEKRRAAIATVIAMSPEIMVMDEPGNGLDPYSRRQLISLLRAFPHTKIVSSHDLDLVLELCERTILLKEGEVRADGPTLEVFRNEPLLAECRLEKPLTMQGCPICRRS